MHSKIAAAICLVAFATAKVDAAHVDGRVFLPDGKPAKEAVVYLEGAGVSVPMQSAMVDQRNKTFIPHVSVITQGTRVRFPNDDTVFHNVFAYYQAKKFDLGMYPVGTLRHVTFDKPGLSRIYCNIHPNMAAYVLAIDTPYFAVSDESGGFTIASVVPRSYTYRAWRAGAM